MNAPLKSELGGGGGVRGFQITGALGEILFAACLYSDLVVLSQLNLQCTVQKFITHFSFRVSDQSRKIRVFY